MTGIELKKEEGIGALGNKYFCFELPNELGFIVLVPAQYAKDEVDTYYFYEDRDIMETEMGEVGEE